MTSNHFRTRFASVRSVWLALVGCVGAFACASLETSAPAVRPIAVIPRPSSVTRLEGSFRGTVWESLVIEDPAALALQLDARLLEILDPGGLRRSGQAGGNRAPVDGRIVLARAQEGLGAEGYRLTVTEERIEIRAEAPVGLFYGMQTLRQLMARDDQSGNFVVPCCEIRDTPRFGWRGQLLDVSRHFLPLEFVYKNIDYLAALKLNVFHWHLTDDQGWRVPIPEYPKLTSIGAWRVDHNDEPWWGRPEQQPGESATYGGFYTREEIAQVIEYARLRGVMVVPEIDMPGHSRAVIAAYPEISCDGAPRTVGTGGVVDENTYCPGKESTFAFVETVLHSVIDLFPSPYVHIGGDECNKAAWRKCPDCQARMASEGLQTVEELQSYFIKRVERMVAARGRTIIGWDEILEGGLAPNAVVMSWRGEAGGVAAAHAGHDVIMTPSSNCYLDLKQGDPESEPDLGYSQLRLPTVYGYEPIPSELDAASAHHVLGIQGNLWGESIRREENAHYMLFPRLFAIAEVAWSAPEHRDWDDFMRRLEPALAELEARGIGYAPSMYQVAIALDDDPVTPEWEVKLTTEHGRVELRYTLDGSDPTGTSAVYERPLRVSQATPIRAAAFRDGQRLGRISQRDSVPQAPR